MFTKDEMATFNVKGFAYSDKATENYHLISSSCRAF